MSIWAAAGMGRTASRARAPRVVSVFLTICHFLLWVSDLRDPFGSRSPANSRRLAFVIDVRCRFLTEPDPDRISRRPMRESDSRTAAIRAGDRDTLAIVVHESLPPLLRAARGAGLEPTDAEDVTQDVLLSFVAKAHQFDGRARVLTYLFGILYRKIAELRRKSWRRELGVDDIESIVASRFDHTGRW
ncbi:MAG: hypothetical protein E4G90_09975, partial [Gemmatimonadales bacterium]